LGWLADDTDALDTNVDHHEDWPRSERQEILPYLLEVNRVFASSVVFRRPFARFDPTLKYSGDWMALLSASYRGPVACVPERLSHWRVHERGAHFASEGVLVEEVRVREAIWTHARQWLRSGQNPVLVKQNLGRHALHIAALYMLFGMPWKARRAAFTALKWERVRRRGVRRFLCCLLPLPLARKRLWPQYPGGMPRSRIEGLAPLSLNL
jgi:hypothetical protein